MNVTHVPTKAGDVLLVPGDIHFPLADDGAVELMIKVAKGVGVNNVCLIGDTFESAGLSRHKSLRAARNFVDRGGTIKAETKAARPMFQALKRMCKPGTLRALGGNHDASWWAAVQDDYPGLMDTEWYELYGDLFDGWHMYDDMAALKYGALLISHGHNLLGSTSRGAAAAVLKNYPGQNSLFGHNHKLDVATTPTFKDGLPVAHGAWSCGHLKRRDVEMGDRFMGKFAASHQQGFALVSFFNRGDDALGFDVSLVRIHRDNKDRPLAFAHGELFRV